MFGAYLKKFSILVGVVIATSHLNAGPLSVAPLQFVQNAGQMPGDVAFYTIHPFPLRITRDGRILLSDVEISFGSTPKFVVGDMRDTSRISYFGKGMEISNIPTYRRVVLKEVYRDIDVILTAIEGPRVEMQIVVRPGGNPGDITLEVSGGALRYSDGIVSVGDLLKITDMVAYQGANELPMEVIADGNTVRFKVSDYDRRFTLIIDPVIAAVVRGDMFEEASSVAVDSAGNVFVAGYTLNSLTFAPSRTVFGTLGDGDAFVTKLSNDLSTHIATAILGSSKDDGAVYLAIDSVGNVFVGGVTFDGSTFAPSRTVFGTLGNGDAFVTKLSNDLSTHIATAILSSSGWDDTYYVTFDGSGNVLIAGDVENVDDFVPGTPVFGTPGGIGDAFVARLNGDLSSLLSVAVVSSPDGDFASGIVIDEGNNILIAGGTYDSRNFAPNRTVFGTAGLTDVFITKLSGDMSTHIATAIIGSSMDDYAAYQSIALDSGGNVLVAGFTKNSFGFSESRDFFGTPGNWDVFVSRLSGDLTTHIATVIVASPDNDMAGDIKLDHNGNVLVSGTTYDAENFAPSRIIRGGALLSDVFVTKISSDLDAHLRTVIVGGRRRDNGYIMAMDRDGNVFVAGTTENPDTLADERHFFGVPGNMDAFVIRIPADLLSVEEGASGRVGAGVSVSLNGDYLRISMSRSGYVGWNLYASDGRLLRRESVGYLPAGKYAFKLNLKRGKYLLIVRAGNTLRRLKVIR